MKAGKELIWHYTTTPAMGQILSDGYLKPTSVGVFGGERPMVWFSANQRWERTVVKGLRRQDGTEIDCHFDDLMKLVGVCRIGVDLRIAPVSWVKHKRSSGIDRRVAKALEDTARRLCADPSDWWGTYEVVPRAEWVKVQTTDAEGQWIDSAWGK